MKIRNRLRSALLSMLASEKTQGVRRWFTETRRRLGGRGHVVSAFLELDDPWSGILAHYLPELLASYDIELRWHLTQSVSDVAYRPEPGMLAAYAEVDAARLAAELGLPFLDVGAAPPVECRRALIDSLAAIAGKPEFGRELLGAITCYWRGDSAGVARRIGRGGGDGAGLLETNRRRLQKLGHYNAATVHYAGEWYQGIDRLHYLTARLSSLGAARHGATGGKLAAARQAMRLTLPVRPPASARQLPPLELFYSFRSPYSYLALGRLFKLVDAFGLALVVRPVLPMVMRGMQVPRPKLAYVAQDTSREARALGIPWGHFADPLGSGVERCLAVLHYARGERREREFLLHAGEAIWAHGIDVSTDTGMRKVTAKCGLFWPDVVAAMREDNWRGEVEQNREDLFDAGCWGVPTLRLGDFTVWGQDRLWLLARQIEERCDTGEGILI